MSDIFNSLEGKRVVLASASPRRRELMHMLTDEFEIIPAVGDESYPEGMASSDVPLYLARLKCEEVAHRCEPDSETIIIGCDTVVVADDEIFGKPRDDADALRMLEALEGGEHFVYSGVCIFYRGEYYSMLGGTRVRFYPASRDELMAYVRTGEPRGKAGAYAIQGLGGLLVEGIDGDFNNVVGLPVSLMAQRLKELIGG